MRTRCSETKARPAGDIRGVGTIDFENDQT